MSNLQTLSTAELSALIAAAQAELATREAGKPAAVTVQVEFDSYNSRRYSSPWIARITKWPVAGRAELAWGSYLGNDKGGVCEVDCVVGDLIRYGQKDGRGGSSSAIYAVVIDETGARIALDEPTAAACFRADAARRTELIAKWSVIREQKNTLLAQSEGLLADWRADQANRDLYDRAIQLEREAKALTYSL